MSTRLRVVVPTGLETLFYVFMAFLLLSVLVAHDIWRHFLASTHTDQRTVTTMDLSIRQAANALTRLINPQVINAAIWAATAALSLCLAGGLVHFVRITKEDVVIMHASRGELNFWTKLLIRIGASIALLVLALLGVAVVLPSVLLTYEKSCEALLNPWSNVPLAVGCVLLTAVCLHAVALLCRLIALRVRVFSEIYE